MLTMNLACNVPADRMVILRLPESVEPGPHELVVVVDEAAGATEGSNAEALMRFSGSLEAFRGDDAVEYQRRIRADWDR